MLCAKSYKIAEHVAAAKRGSSDRVKARTPEVGVVMMSGFGVEVEPAELRTNGVDLVLSKPLQIKDVLRAMATIQRAGRARAGEAGAA